MNTCVPPSSGPSDAIAGDGPYRCGCMQVLCWIERGVSVRVYDPEPTTGRRAVA
jgi:hypothetical protein